MKRIIRLFSAYFMANVKAMLLYDLDYILGIIAMFLKTAIGFCYLFLIFYYVDSLGSWNFHQMLFLYGLATLSFSLWHCFFVNTLGIPSYIRSGDFDSFLLKPVNPLLQILMEGFDEDGWGELLLGLVTVFYAASKLEIIGARMLLLPLFAISGCLIFSAVSILLSSIAFFTIGSFDFTDNIEDFKEIAKYPMSIFGKKFSIFFTAIFPLAFASYYPALYLLKLDESFVPFLSFPIGVLFFFLAYQFWNFAMKRYSGSGT